MSLGGLEEYKLESIYIIESIFENKEPKTKRGTCFSISPSLLLTADHVISGAASLKVYLSSDAYDAGEYINASCIYANENLDIAILKLANETIHNIDLYSANISLDTEVVSCGYPIEKEHYHAPIKVKVTNTFAHMSSKEYSFEVSQSSTVTKYSGMSGSPVMYNGLCIGALLVQQGGNTLYSVSTKDILNDPLISKIIEDENVNVTIQDGINYKAPKHPLSPFKYKINCNAEHPNIKGIDIGFIMKKWNIGQFTETVYDWIIDYCLSYKDQANFVGTNRSLFKFARSNYHANDLNALGDLCLHIAIRESYDTIPVMNKVFDINNKTFSCTHAVLNFDSIELWIGASSVNTTIEDAVKSATNNVEYILGIKSLNTRLFTLTSEIDDSWPHKEKLTRLANSNLELDERFDKIIIPIFIMHDSELITNYDKQNFLNLFNSKIENCRHLIKCEINGDLIDLIDLRVFYFPVSDINELNNALLQELNS